MTGYLTIIDKLKAHFDSDIMVTEVTKGALDDIDLPKQTLFPLVHIIVGNATFESRVIRFSVTLFAMDVVDVSKSEATDRFMGNNNEDYVLDTTLAILNRAFKQMDSGDLFSDNFVVDGNPTCEPFTERFENLLAGWAMTFDVMIPNDMTIC